MKCMTTVRNLYISTHALTEGDQSDDERVQFQYNFNSRPHGGRLSKLPSGNTALYFNSRPHGGRPLMRSFLCHWHYFNSRPHGGRHRRCRKIILHVNISTHALTEGDLVTVLIIHTVYDISTHALTEGDAVRSASLRALISFQLTPSRRATVTVLIIHTVYDISTHALTEGDSVVIRSASNLLYFNSRPHGGRRRSVYFMEQTH